MPGAAIRFSWMSPRGTPSDLAALPLKALPGCNLRHWLQCLIMTPSQLAWSLPPWEERPVRSGHHAHFFCWSELCDEATTVTQAKVKTGRVVSPELLAEFEQIAAAAGCELVHAEFKGNTLRIFVDKPEGVSLTDCQHVSKQVSALLDVVDFGQGRYVLEVSSPGLDRQLYGPRDYERFVGRLARVTIQEPGTATKRTVVARLAEYRPPGEGEGADGGAVVLLDEKSGEQSVVSLKNIRLARLEIEL